MSHDGDFLEMLRRAAREEEQAKSIRKELLKIMKPPVKIKFTSEDLSIANYFFEKISLIRRKRKPNMETWADTLRLMRERDGLTHDQIRQGFDDFHNDKFWRANILSPQKLRKHWHRLEQVRRKKNGKNWYNSIDSVRAETEKELGEINDIADLEF